MANKTTKISSWHFYPKYAIVAGENSIGLLTDQMFLIRAI